ncbi:MAG: hypothetical protein L3K26_18765 [Candidatus Hydrogenedentes bacterium]|nr:hypothetical protein [Candidatus Hydrogenedentota bacterium]
MRKTTLAIATLVLLLAPVSAFADFSISTFQADVTPSLGMPLCGGDVAPVVSITDPLTARGIVFFPEGEQPVVLCAVDWVIIANEGHTAWREALAKAAQTDIGRVTVHVLHQHDAPFLDFTLEEMLDKQGLGGTTVDVDFARKAIRDTAAALSAALPQKKVVTHVASGEGIVEKVASNRRILDENGKVRTVRWTATTDPAVRAEPVGTLDPFCKSVSFWNGDRTLAVLTYYATHPQSHYGKGHVSADFVGMARSAREEALPGVPHIHFNGAGGNLGAGKWNDGSPENRPVLAKRLEAGMRRAWEGAKKVPVDGTTLQWDVKTLVLPGRDDLSRAHEESVLAAKEAGRSPRMLAAIALAWMDRNNEETPIEISRLKIGGIQLLHLPGELFVEYQLAAQDMAPDNMVCVAAYGDGGPGYIGTEVSYGEGGYETRIYVAQCGGKVEQVLLKGIRDLVE